jgi:transposase-like protein
MATTRRRFTAEFKGEAVRLAQRPEVTRVDCPRWFGMVRQG